MRPHSITVKHSVNATEVITSANIVFKKDFDGRECFVIQKNMGSIIYIISYEDITGHSLGEQEITLTLEDQKEICIKYGSKRDRITGNKILLRGISDAASKLSLMECSSHSTSPSNEEQSDGDGDADRNGSGQADGTGDRTDYSESHATIDENDDTERRGNGDAGQTISNVD